MAEKKDDGMNKHQRFVANQKKRGFKKLALQVNEGDIERVKNYVKRLNKAYKKKHNV